MKAKDERLNDSASRCADSSLGLSPSSSCPWPAIPPPRRIALTTLSPHPCPYLPGRTALSRAFLCDRMPPMLYHELMDCGFRRSGSLIYQPICAGCRECRPIRVPVDRFAPGKTQRRIWRRNQDLSTAIATPKPTDEKFDLYRRYVEQWHESEKDNTFESFVDFLYTSPVDTLEVMYRDPRGRLIGVGIVDFCERKSLSTVYFYFDPAEARRGLGTFSSLWEIAFARERGIPYYYLGYFIRDCSRMNYKARFEPCELLGPDQVWREHAGGTGPPRSTLAHRPAGGMRPAG